MNASTYMVRIGGCQVGTVTTLGTIESMEQAGMDYYVVTFSTGEVRRFRYNQAVAVVEGE